MRRRNYSLRALAVVVELAGLVAAVVALVVAVGNSRRLDDLTADNVRLSRLVMSRASSGGNGREEERPSVNLPADWARGGELVVRLRHRPLAINPLLVADAAGRSVCGLVGETLARRDPDTGEFHPGLARLWTVSPDRTTFTFELDPLACFSDGKPVTTDDVIFTFDWLRDERRSGQAAAAVLADLESVEAVDSRTVRFRFSRPYFLAMAAVADRWIVPRHVYGALAPEQMQAAAWRDLLVGSGPFVVEKTSFSVVAKEIVLRRNNAYWDRGHVPALDRIEFRVVEGDQRALELLKTQGIHVTPLSPEQYAEAAADENFREYDRLFADYTPQAGNICIVWNHRRPPFDDARVRRAMTHLAPRQRMADEIYMGLARVIEVPFWSEGPQYPPDLEPKAFDPEAAARLLDEAGWRRGEGSSLRTKDDRPLEARLLVLKTDKRHDTLCGWLCDEARKVGVGIEVEPVTLGEMQARMASGDFDALLLAWTTAAEVDPYLLWHSSQAGEGGLNVAGFSSPEADRLTEAIRHELDAGKRNAMCHELGRLLAREQPCTVLLEPQSLLAVSTRFQGVRRYRLGLRPQEWYIPRRAP